MSRKKIIGIYKITSPRGKVYIGQSVNILQRKYKYSKIHCKGQYRIERSIKKYGWDNHKFEIIEECTLDMLNERERYWQEYYNVLGENGMNCRLTNTKDKKQIYSSDLKNKMSLLRKKRQIGKDNPFYGKKHSSETKIKISESRKGKAMGEKNGYSKKVVDTVNGKVFNTVKEASIYAGISRSLLSYYLSGKVKNKTNLAFL